MNHPQITPDDYRARVAAEVAARYGVQCKPEVVQHVERGATSAPQWVWDGKALVPVEPRDRSESLRAANNAKWATFARAKRLREADEVSGKRVPKSVAARERAQDVMSAHREATMRAAAERAADVARFAAGGKTIDQIAKYMGVNRKSATTYCRMKGIEWVAVERTYGPKVMTLELKARMVEMAATMTSQQIADALGITLKAALARLRGLGVQAYRPKAEKIERAPRAADQPLRVKKKRASRAGSYVSHRPVMDAKQAEIAARREKVLGLVNSGMSDRQVAEALGITKLIARRDRSALGIKVLPKEAKKRRCESNLDEIRQRRDKRDKQIIELRTQGLTIDAICRELQCGVGTVSNAMTRLGLTTLGFRGRAGDERIMVRFVALQAKGLSPSEIAAELGLSRSKVKNMAERVKKLAAMKEAA